MSEDEEEFFDAAEPSDDPNLVWGRRKRLPVPMPSRALNIWSFLKSCIGKELTKVTMPIHFNEPNSFLQRISEYAEYFSLIEQAMATPDPVYRLELVAAFAVSAAASNWERLGKPFNPVLGETYEYQNRGHKIVCEQVSHHPPISAFHAEGKGYKFYGNIWPKLTFWGKTAEVQPRGVVTLHLLNYGEVYTWQNVEAYIHNIIIGKLWVEHKGKMRVTNETSGSYVDLTWRPTSWFKSSHQQRVDGYLYSSKGERLRGLYGKWTEAMFSVPVDVWRKYIGGDDKKKSKTDLVSLNNGEDEISQSESLKHGDLDTSIEEEEDPLPVITSPCDLQLPEQRLLWKVTPRPPDSAQYYNFTAFAMQLNEMTLELFEANLLPPTDCRFRPDMRYMELGDLNNGSVEKHRLEEKQREHRRALEASLSSSKSIVDSPNSKSKSSSKKQEKLLASAQQQGLWFKPGPKHNSKKQQYEWLFTGEYFDRDWSKCPDIF